MHRLFAVVFLTLVPGMVLAADSPVSRRDGFLMLWQSLHRPVSATREFPYVDVLSGDEGFAEITFAKSRGILGDDDERFYPDVSLLQQDALLWLFRTRSVAAIEDMEPEDLPTLLERYPITSCVTLSSVEVRHMDACHGFDPSSELRTGSTHHDTLTSGDLASLMQKLDTLLATEVHEVSLYAEKFHGRGTASGEPFDMHALTAAHRTLPFNTLVKVTNVENQESVIVRINDRGPFIEGRDMDLSLAAFTTIGERSAGKLHATFQRLGDSAMVSSCSADTRYQQRITRDIRLQRGLPQALSLGASIILKANRTFVVRSVTYPDGLTVRVQDFVFPKEAYTFKPSVAGTYLFSLGSPQGRTRVMQMEVVEC